MSLFRDEAPVLGQNIQIKELSGFGAGSPVVNYFKPTTREIISVSPLSATSTAGWAYVAPFKCQVISAKVIYTVAGGALAAVDIAKFTQAGQPQAPGTAPNGTTVVDQLSATIPLTGAANTVYAGTLSTAAGQPTVLNAGDALAYNFSGTLTGLANLLIQIEITQLG